MTIEPSRRRFLSAFLAGASGAAISDVPARAAEFADARVCPMTPEAIEGPFYFDPNLVRSQIADGKSGIPIDVRLTIVDRGCRPIAGTRVDLWHCDAQGLYSNYPGQGDDPRRPLSTRGEYFLRGTQFADEGGVVRFLSIYPGWYPGRAPHLHVKALIGVSVTLTGQIFFPDAVSAAVYRNDTVYGGRDGRLYVPRRRDAIARAAGMRSTAHVTPGGNGYTVSLTIGLQPRA